MKDKIPTCNMKILKLTKQEKILLVLYILSGCAKRNTKFEDIAVALFKKFPKDFHLKGYDDYPDSGDSVKRALYTLRDRGFLLVNNMTFSLTDKGLYLGKQLNPRTKSDTIAEQDNLDRYVANEMNRIKKSEGFKLFISKQEDKILDTDFYGYLGVSVRVEKGDFLGRLNTLRDLVTALENTVEKDLGTKRVIEYHQFILNKFRKLIKYHQKDSRGYNE